jgi:hypothetical protein
MRVIPSFFTIGDTGNQVSAGLNDLMGLLKFQTHSTARMATFLMNEMQLKTVRPERHQNGLSWLYLRVIGDEVSDGVLRAVPNCRRDKSVLVDDIIRLKAGT